MPRVDSSPAIRLRGLTKRFDSVAVLAGVDLDVRAGEIFGYVGRNGAGKTTTIRILCGMTDDFDGEATVCGYDVRTEALAVKRRVGFVPETAALWDELTAMEFLRFVGTLHALGDEVSEARARTLLDCFGLGGEADARLGTFSKGMRQKVLLSAALVHDPDVLLLDEPLSGLDAHAVVVVKEVLVQLARAGKAIFYSSHVLDVVERVCDRIALLDAGRIVALGTFEDTAGALAGRLARADRHGPHQSRRARRDRGAHRRRRAPGRPVVSAAADPRQIRALLAVKRALDARRQHGWVQGSKRITPYRWSLIVHAAMGLWLAALPGLLPSAFTAVTLGLTVVMAMLAFDLVADYSGLLLDATETSVLGARPVAPRTLLVARLLHVASYLGAYTAALALPTCVAGAWRWGVPFLPAYVVALGGTLTLVLAGVTLVYLGLMRRVSAERLRDATLWAQLAMTALTVAGYAVASFVDFRSGAGIEGRPWLALYPPAWMAALPALAAGAARRPLAPLAAMGLAAPIGLAFLAVRLGAGFRADLPPTGAPPRPPPTRPRRVWLARLGRRAAAPPAVWATIDLVWTLTARDRGFKTRTYPVLIAVVLFVAVVGVLARVGVWQPQLGGVARTDLHLFLLYYVVVVLPAPLLMVGYGDRPEAAWVFRSLPIAMPGAVLVATLAVLVTRFVAPVFGATALLVLGLWGPRVIADVTLAFAAAVLVAGRMTLVAGRRLPFAAPPPGGQSGTTAGAVARGMLLVGLLAAIHWLLRRPGLPLPQPWPVLAAIPVVLALAVRAVRAAAATGWDAIPQP